MQRFVLIPILVFCIIGCTVGHSNVQLTPDTEHIVNYNRGQAEVISELVNHVSLTHLGQRESYSLFAVKVKNLNKYPLTVSSDLITIEPSNDLSARAVKFDELSLVDANASSLWQGLSQVVAIAPAFIPGAAGQATGVASGLIRSGINQSNVSNKKGLSEEQVVDNYFRRHTLQPDEEYSGYLYVTFSDVPATNQKVLLTVNLGIDRHKFLYTVAD